jgi:menaquinol-cytochrome c reductase iron-sulfur subunit
MNPASDDVASIRFPERRSFLKRFVAVIVGSLIVIFPFAAGLAVFFDPIWRRRHAQGAGAADGTPFVRVCPLDALPTDGTPRLFPVVTDVVDAWSRTPAQRIGSVFLSRTEADGKPDITCFTTTCPHLGCAVDWHADEDHFQCPCHESAFAKDGKKLFGPSLRGLDQLDVKLDDQSGQTGVLVAYERFRTGVKERIPIG